MTRSEAQFLTREVNAETAIPYGSDWSSIRKTGMRE
jgi:hypothetical protein